MSNTRKTRIRLWENDPRCHWCEKITVNPYRLRDGGETYDEGRGNAPHNLATVDHVYPRIDRKLKIIKRLNQRNPLVLACFECNQRRNVEQLTELRDEILKNGGPILPGGLLGDNLEKRRLLWANDEKSSAIIYRENADKKKRGDKIKRIVAKKLDKKNKKEQRKARERELLTKIFGNSTQQKELL